MVVQEDPRYSREYLEPDKRSTANAVQVFFTDGTSTPTIEVDYPVGHRRRRSEGIPLLIKKFKNNLGTRLPPEQCETIVSRFSDINRLEKMPVDEFVELFVTAQ